MANSTDGNTIKEQSRFLQNEQWMNVQADMVVEWQEKQARSGNLVMCPVCHKIPRGNGVTCGAKDCITAWLHPTGPMLPGRIIVESVVRPSDALKKPPKVTAVTDAVAPFTGDFLADRMFALFIVDDNRYETWEALGHLRAFYTRYKLSVPPNDHALLVAAHQQRIKLSQSEEGYRDAAKRSIAWLEKQKAKR